MKQSSYKMKQFNKKINFRTVLNMHLKHEFYIGSKNLVSLPPIHQHVTYRNVYLININFKIYMPISPFGLGLSSNEQKCI
jgi:hypothetical protein